MNDLIAKLYPQQCFADVCRVFGGELFFLGRILEIGHGWKRLFWRSCGTFCDNGSSIEADGEKNVLHFKTQGGEVKYLFLSTPNYAGTWFQRNLVGCYSIYIMFCEFACRGTSGQLKCKGFVCYRTRFFFCSVAASHIILCDCGNEFEFFVRKEKQWSVGLGDRV